MADKAALKQLVHDRVRSLLTYFQSPPSRLMKCDRCDRFVVVADSNIGERTIKDEREDGKSAHPE